MERSVEGYNLTVNALRNEIELQKEYQEKLQNLQKNHLKTGVAGIQ